MKSTDRIVSLVGISFALEALFEKEGCTSRVLDLPDKPLEDFIIAGINVLPAFQKTIADIEHGKLQHSFAYFPEALHMANQFKGPKTVNFGLLEIMFLTVHAALTKNADQDTLQRMDQLLHENGSAAVKSLLEARKIAWNTSINDTKKSFPAETYQDAKNVHTFYTALQNDYPADHANHQWAHHALHGHPILQRYTALLPNNIYDMKRETKTIHATVTQEFPEIKIGILADMFAAAIFINLFHNSLQE